MFDVRSAFDGLVIVDSAEVPLNGSNRWRDVHPEADAFLDATEEERERLRKKYETDRVRLRAAAVAAPRPLPREQRPDKIDDKLRGYIQQAVRVGVSQRELARRLNVSRATIDRALKPKARRGRPPTRKAA